MSCDLQTLFEKSGRCPAIAALAMVANGTLHDFFGTDIAVPRAAIAADGRRVGFVKHAQEHVLTLTARLEVALEIGVTQVTLQTRHLGRQAPTRPPHLARSVIGQQDHRGQAGNDAHRRQVEGPDIVGLSEGQDVHLIRTI